MKAVLHYVFLVGIPVLVVLGILRLGENTLKAPASVEGNWLLALPENATTSSCKTMQIDVKEPMLNISQSGPHLVLTFNDENRTDLKGTLNELSINAHSAQVSSDGLSSLSLTLTVDRDAEPDQMQGVLTLESCGETWSFTAVRQPETEQTASGGH
ncbi:MAG TPA: hypothetical protein PK530_15870 [Anaerolineales bacterium]|nr:hypothetical protein [Anaerolineales bacterium]